MSEDGKIRGAGFWCAAAVVVALVLYPASWGPWIWLEAEGRVPEPLIWVDHVFDPLRSVLNVSPEWATDYCNGYLRWWVERARIPYYDPIQKPGGDALAQVADRGPADTP
jgi:hypothetical protein